MPFWKWSKTAATNASVDPTINYAEGQAPSSLNDSARAVMARLAEYRDDISGALVTGGSSSAYTVSSNQGFDSLANMNGAMVAFTPHASNAEACTLNVDGLGAKPVRSAPGAILPSLSLILGTPYVASYNNNDGVWYLMGGVPNSYGVPLAGGMDYWADAAPNSAFVFPYGQALSRTYYSALFDKLGTKYGSGDGSTTFNLPDKRGRSSVPLDNMGGSAASRVTSARATPDGVTLGSVGGAQEISLTGAQNGPHIHASTLTDPGHSHTYNAPLNAITVINNAGTTIQYQFSNVVSTASAFTGMSINNASSGSGDAHSNMPPFITCNYIMRVI